MKKSQRIEEKDGYIKFEDNLAKLSAISLPRITTWLKKP